MRKRFLAALLAACMLMGLLSVTASAAEAGDTEITLSSGAVLTLSNPIVRVEKETVMTEIGCTVQTDSGSTMLTGIYEPREQTVYVIPLGTTVTWQAGFNWIDAEYVYDESEQAYSTDQFYLGDTAGEGGSVIVSDPSWLDTTDIWGAYFYSVSSGEPGEDADPEQGEAEGGSTEYYYTDDEMAAMGMVFFRFTREGVSHPFTDLKETAYYYGPVLWAYECGITAGTTATTFSPDSVCTRGQVVTFLWRAAGCPKPASTSNPFTDVKANAYYYEAVLWAAEEGITAGTTSTTFSPNAKVTRAQFVAFLYRFAGSPDVSGTANPFTDLNERAYYYNAVLWAAGNGITYGVTATTFAPENSCTRGQVVSFLYRCF